MKLFDLNEENLKFLERAINQEFYSEKENYIIEEDDLAIFFYIKFNKINFNFSEFFIKQEKEKEKSTPEKVQEIISIKKEEENLNSSKEIFRKVNTRINFITIFAKVAANLNLM